MDSEEYDKYCRHYSKAKMFGIRGVYASLSVYGVLNLVKEITKSRVRKWGRKKVSACALGALTWMGAPCLAFVTNSTTIINSARRVHIAVSFVAECVEDSTNIAWLPLDIILFGQPVPIGTEGRFNLMSNETDVFFDE